MSIVENTLKEMGYTLPSPMAPVANYAPFAVFGDHCFISGQISKPFDGDLITGRLGENMDVAAGAKAAEVCALNILAQAKLAVGNLDKIKKIVKLNGFVVSSPDFTDQPLVINGASDLIGKAFAKLGNGTIGVHARSAVGVAALPLGAAVEIDAHIIIGPSQ